MGERIIKKQKMLIFHPVLATYRIDQFNLLDELFDLEVVFFFDQMTNFKMNQNFINKQCRFKFSYLLRGPKFKGRIFRFGIYRKINQFKPDIIIGYEYSLTMQYLILLKSLGLINQKLGSMIDDSLDICYSVQNKIRKVARDNTIKYFDFVVVLSNEVSEFHCKKFGLTNEKIIISPILQLPERLRRNTFEIENTAKTYIQNYDLAGKKILLFVGRFVPEKALTRFIQTISNHLYSSDDYKLVLVGDGEELDNLKRTVDQERLKDKILFPGKFESDELYAWYAAASGFVLPSISEAFGAVVNEALIFGLTVMCSQFAGASTLINNNNGIIFNPLNENETLERLKCFVSNIKPRDKISIADHPPLLNDHRIGFLEEWGKLAHEQNL